MVTDEVHAAIVLLFALLDDSCAVPGMNQMGHYSNNYYQVYARERVFADDDPVLIEVPVGELERN